MVPDTIEAIRNVKVAEAKIKHLKECLLEENFDGINGAYDTADEIATSVPTSLLQTKYYFELHDAIDDYKSSLYDK